MRKWGFPSFAFALTAGVGRSVAPRFVSSTSYYGGAEIALYGVYEISKFLTAPARLEITLAQVLNQRACGDACGRSSAAAN